MFCYFVRIKHHHGQGAYPGRQKHDGDARCVVIKNGTFCLDSPDDEPGQSRLDYRTIPAKRVSGKEANVAGGAGLGVLLEITEDPGSRQLGVIGLACRVLTASAVM